jgi:hypothetical protein
MKINEKNDYHFKEEAYGESRLIQEVDKVNFLKILHLR